MQIYRDGPYLEPGEYLNGLIRETLQLAVSQVPGLDLGRVRFISLGVGNGDPRIDDMIWGKMAGGTISRVITLGPGMEPA